MARTMPVAYISPRMAPDPLRSRAISVACTAAVSGLALAESSACLASLARYPSPLPSRSSPRARPRRTTRGVDGAGGLCRGERRLRAATSELRVRERPRKARHRAGVPRRLRRRHRAPRARVQRAQFDRGAVRRRDPRLPEDRRHDRGRAPRGGLRVVRVGRVAHGPHEGGRPSRRGGVRGEALVDPVDDARPDGRRPVGARPARRQAPRRGRGGQGAFAARSRARLDRRRAGGQPHLEPHGRGEDRRAPPAAVRRRARPALRRGPHGGARRDRRGRCAQQARRRRRTEGARDRGEPAAAADRGCVVARRGVCDRGRGRGRAPAVVRHDLGDVARDHVVPRGRRPEVRRSARKADRARPRGREAGPRRAPRGVPAHVRRDPEAVRLQRRRLDGEPARHLVAWLEEVANACR